MRLNTKKIFINLYLGFMALIHYIYYSIQNLIRARLHNTMYQELLQFKDKYKGESVFLIGTGPSLRESDLEMLKNKYTFGVNSIAAAIRDNKFSPTFYGFTDGEVLKDWKREIFAINDSILFYTIKSPEKRRYINVLRKKSNAYEFLQKDERWWQAYAKKMPQGFSKDITKEVYWGYTCVYSMMQIIAYMGFSTVYLVGMDCVYEPGKKNYHDRRDEKTIQNGEFGGQVVPGFLKAWISVKENIKDLDIEIYNATRGGMLEIFERVDLDFLLDSNEI